MHPALSCLRIASSTSRPSPRTALSSDQSREQDRIANVFIEFQTAWLIYWNAYVDLQNQLYEAIKAARDVSWLAATDPDKLSRLNNSQRELFASMPRRMDYMPLGQINRNLDSAISKLDQLEKAMSTEKEKCLGLMDAIQIIQQKIEIAKKELQNKPKTKRHMQPNTTLDKAENLVFTDILWYPPRNNPRTNQPLPRPPPPLRLQQDNPHTILP